MITIIQQPPQFSPARNQILYEFETDNSTTLYFNVIVRNANNNDEIIAKNKIYLAPESKSSVINLSPLLSAYTSTPIVKNGNEINSYDTTIQYNIEVKGIKNNGDETGDILNIDNKYAYNAKLDGYQLFDFLNYTVEADTKANFLTSFPSNQKVHYSTDTHLYFLSKNSPLSYFKVNIETITGAKFEKKINFINNNSVLHSLLISTKSLGLDFNVLPQKLKNIKICGYASNGVEVTETRTLYITSFKCGIDVINMYWENKEGGYDSIAFTQPKKQISVTKETIDTNQYLNKNNGVYSSNQRILNVDSTVTYTVVSPPLTDWGFDKVAEIIQSKNVFVEDLQGNLVPVMINENNINILQKRYTKRQNYLTISFTTNDNINLKIYTDSSIGTNGFNYDLDVML